MIRYEIIVYWSDEDQAFIAEVVIKEWIEAATELGRPIPQPKGRLVFA